MLDIELEESTAHDSSLGNESNRKKRNNQLTFLYSIYLYVNYVLKPQQLLNIFNGLEKRAEPAVKKAMQVFRNTVVSQQGAKSSSRTFVLTPFTFILQNVGINPNLNRKQNFAAMQTAFANNVVNAVNAAVTTAGQPPIAPVQAQQVQAVASQAFADFDTITTQYVQERQTERAEAAKAPAPSAPPQEQLNKENGEQEQFDAEFDTVYDGVYERVEPRYTAMVNDVERIVPFTRVYVLQAISLESVMDQLLLLQFGMQMMMRPTFSMGGRRREEDNVNVAAVFQSFYRPTVG